jgi:hypothetical protein
MDEGTPLLKPPSGGLLEKKQSKCVSFSPLSTPQTPKTY